jgi:hypothetical protein
MNPESSASQFSRRRFLGQALAAATASSLATFPALGAEDAKSVAPDAPAPRPQFKRKLKPVADACGDALGVDKSRRFSTLSGYKRLIESSVEAVALQTPPYFMAEPTPCRARSTVCSPVCSATKRVHARRGSPWSNFSGRTNAGNSISQV